MATACQLLIPQSGMISHMLHKMLIISIFKIVAATMHQMATKCQVLYIHFFHSIFPKTQWGCSYHLYFIDEQTGTREIEQFAQDHTASMWPLCASVFSSAKQKVGQSDLRFEVLGAGICTWGIGAGELHVEDRRAFVHSISFNPNKTWGR